MSRSIGVLKETCDRGFAKKVNVDRESRPLLCTQSPNHRGDHSHTMTMKTGTRYYFRWTDDAPNEIDVHVEFAAEELEP